jgi:hypothetical protein
MWASPSKTTRKEEALKCPKSCFLIPESLKFPVCDPSSCRLSCAGLHAAYVRAREWKYDEVAARAAKLMESNCGWHPKLLGGTIEQAQRTHRWARRSIHQF